MQFVVNYEEGGENNVLHGDAASEAFLSEIVGAQPWPGQRHWNMESIYEYGARAGFWRLWRMFTERRVPVTVYGVATALARNPGRGRGDEGGRLGDRQPRAELDRIQGHIEDEERRDIAEAIRLHTEVTGARPLGWYYQGARRSTRSASSRRRAASSIPPTAMPTTCPTGSPARSGPHLIIPYTLDANDMRFATPQGFNSGDQFFTYLKDSFDPLYAEGEAGAPKMMSVGLHCRLVGRPGRAAALARFLDYVKAKDKVWLPRRIDIAWHWHAHHKPAARSGAPDGRRPVAETPKTRRSASRPTPLKSSKVA